MAQQHMFPNNPDKNTTGTNPTDRRGNEMPDAHNTGKKPEQDVDGRNPEGNSMDRGAVPNPGRDITTGGTGGDGTNRKMPVDSTTEAADADSDVPTDAAEITDEKEEEPSA